MGGVLLPQVQPATKPGFNDCKTLPSHGVEAANEPYSRTARLADETVASDDYTASG